MSPPSGNSSTSVDLEPVRGVSRRRALAALGTGGATVLGGCAGPFGLGDSRSLNPPEVTGDAPTERVWNFPRDPPQDNTAVQTYLEQRSRVPARTESAAVRFRFGATVFGDSGYRHDRFAVRLRAPARPDADRPPAAILVRPPGGGWRSFRTYREDGETVVSLGELDTAGTIHFDFLVAPEQRPAPDALGYDFELAAAKGGPFGGTATASARGQVPVVREDS